MDKIKGQLAGVAALLGVIAAIGGGFVKYGEIVTKIDTLESKEWTAVDTTGIETSLAVLEEKVEKLEMQTHHIVMKLVNTIMTHHTNMIIVMLRL